MDEGADSRTAPRECRREQSSSRARRAREPSRQRAPARLNGDETRREEHVQSRRLVFARHTSIERRSFADVSMRTSFFLAVVQSGDNSSSVPWPCRSERIRGLKIHIPFDESAPFSSASLASMKRVHVGWFSRWIRSGHSAHSFRNGSIRTARSRLGSTGHESCTPRHGGGEGPEGIQQIGVSFTIVMALWCRCRGRSEPGSGPAARMTAFFSMSKNPVPPKFRLK